MSKSIKLNITVPKGLREQMRKFDLNWSSVAARAFEEAMQRAWRASELRRRRALLSNAPPPHEDSVPSWYDVVKG